MTKTEFRIREMTEDDLDEVQFMHYGVIPESWVWNFHGYLIEIDGLGFVAENGKPLGYALSAMTGSQARIDYLLVSPHYQRNGIATDLVNAVAERYKADGAGSLFVNISADNEAALALARKHGFSLSGVKINDSDNRFYGRLEL